MMAMSLKISVTEPSVSFEAAIPATVPGFEERMPDKCPLNDKSLMRVVEYELADDVRREEVDMLSVPTRSCTLKEGRRQSNHTLGA